MTKHSSKSAASRSPTKGKESPKVSSSALDLRDIPLTFPEFASVDHSQVVPRYSSVLKRSEDEGIGLDDVDSLQMELEALLSSTVVRKMTLKEEYKNLTNLDKSKGSSSASRSAGKRGPSSPGKRAPEDRFGKKQRISGGKPFESFGKVIGIPKLSKTEPKLAPNFDPLQNEQIRPLAESSRPSAPKNETPGRFWSFVEPYCANITHNDLQFLEDLIRTHEDISDYFAVPKKGKHYTRKWAEGGEDEEEDEDDEEAVDEESRNREGENGSFDKRDNTRSNGELGDLTQRLVAGLMEENNEASVDSLSSKFETNGELGAGGGGPTHFTQQAESLEAQVYKELEEQGIFDSAKEDEEDEDDEILEELKRCQMELRAVSGHNLQQMKRLMKSAREEMSRQELRNRLNDADKRVMEAYKKISTARSQKKEPTKKDRDQAWKFLKEREVILKQLESI